MLRRVVANIPTAVTVVENVGSKKTVGVPERTIFEPTNETVIPVGTTPTLMDDGAGLQPIRISFDCLYERIDVTFESATTVPLTLEN